MTILFSLNTNNSDYNNYLAIFAACVQDVNSTNAGPAYRYLCNFSGKIGLNYNQMLLFIVFVCLILIITTIKKHTKNWNFVLVLYIIFPFFIDVVQVRNFIAMSIIVFSFNYLLSLKRGGNIKFVICVIIATLFHSVAIIYMVFLLAKILSKKWLIFISLLGTIIGLTITSTDIPYRLALMFLPISKVTFFTNTIGLGFGLLFNAIMQIASVVLVAYSYHIIQVRSKKNVKDKYYIDKQRLVNLVLKINIILLPIISLYYYNATFTRIYRNVFILNYIVFALTYIEYQIKTKKRFTYILIVFLYTMAMCAINIGPYIQDTLIAILNNNLLFK